MTYTLGQVKTLVRQRADIEHSTHVSSSVELTAIINDSMKELLDVGLSIMGPENYLISVAAQIVADSSTFVFGSDTGWPRKLVRIDVLLDGFWRPLRRMNLWDTDLQSASQAWTTDIDITYSLKATTSADVYGPALLVNPPPNATTTVRVWMVPAGIAVTTDSQTLPTNLDTWLEYVIIDAAIKCKEKEESDTSGLERAKANIIERMRTYAAPVDTNPMTIADARSDEDDTYGAPYDVWWY